MGKIERIELPAGRIVSIKLCESGTYEVLLEVSESEMVSKIEKTEEMFVRIEASKLSLRDKFMQYKPKTDNERRFKEMLEEVIRRGINDFYRPRIDPSFDDDGEICFNPGMQPAVGKSYNWWAENAKKFNPERKSRLGTKSEYVAFLGVLLKKLIEEGWSKEEAWDAVCNDSKKLGHYWNSEKAKHYFETTGSREICGFFDLANTCKILVEDIEAGGFWLAGGCYGYGSNGDPLADLGRSGNRNLCLFNSVGWLVLE